MSSKAVDRERSRGKEHSYRSAGTPGGYRGRSRTRTGTASLYTHLMVPDPRRPLLRARFWPRVPIAMREAVAGGE